MLNLKVDGMSCGHCVETVTEAIKSEYPQATVTIDLPTKNVKIEGVDDASTIVNRIQQAGYSVVR